MLNTKIGGIPLLWIMMAQSAAAKRKRKSVTIPKNIGLGDFVIDPLSQQWARVIKIDNAWVDVLLSGGGTGSDPESRRRQGARDIKLYKANVPLPEFREDYDRALESATSKFENPNRHGSEYSIGKAKFVVYKIGLQFADDKKATRSVGLEHAFVCVHAPEIFNFDFEQLKSLTKNAFRGVKKGKKKATKKKAAKKRTKKRSAA